MKLHFRILVFAIFLSHVTSSTHGQTGQEGASRLNMAIIKEVLQTINYTYLHVKVDTSLKWLAVPAGTFSVGDTCYFKKGLVMPDFTSKELKRTFDQVLFLESVGSTPATTNKAAANVPEHSTKVQAGKLDVIIAPAAGGITIADLFQNKEKYNGQVILIRGQVVKFTAKIMGKNWVHLQDGTSFGDKFDLTATMDDTLKKGDIVTLECKVTLNKDFGSGYFFDVILENATVK